MVTSSRRRYKVSRPRHRSRRRKSAFPFREAVLWILGAAVAVVMIAITCHHRADQRSHDGQGDYSAGDYEVHGIDVSHHQGKVDWGKVSRATLHGKSIRFAFAKCTEGRTRQDANYDFNRIATRRHGLLFGAYHYFVPGRSAEDQATNFIKHAHLHKGDLPPVLDVERSGHLSPAELSHQVKRWLKLVGDHYDCIPIVYTYHDFMQKRLVRDSLKDYPFWKALYLDDGRIRGNDWAFCQYTRHGHVAGIRDGVNDYVDLNVFAGTPEDLKALTLGAGVPPSH